MSYQLPPELKTNKFNSLPENLRIKAEAIMAKKFGIPEVIEEKPKQKSNKKYPEPESYTFDSQYKNGQYPHSGYQTIQVRVETDRMEPVYPDMGIGAARFDPRDMIRGTTRPTFEQNNIVLDDRMPIKYKEETINNAIWHVLRKIEHAGAGRRTNIILMSSIGTMRIDNRRDIFEFIKRYT